MKRFRNWTTLVALATAVTPFAHRTSAAEPNETFATATALTPGVLSVMDSLSPGLVNEPDTLLGTHGAAGEIDLVDDNSSTRGNGLASGVADVPIPFGMISFSVTGYPNFGFDGFHDESGRYDVYIDVYDIFGIQVGEFVASETLDVDAVDEFMFFDNAWVNGSYSANIDNQIPVGGDVDFYRFSGLTPGVSFRAETLAPGSSDIDTFLGWFSAAGAILDTDDDGAGGTLSRIDGVVPAGGNLTLAVTGYGDETFGGAHFEFEAYELRVTLGGALNADFNNSGSVSGADLPLWRNNFGPSAIGDADNDNDTDGADLLIWQRELGLGGVAATAAPEPASRGLLALALLCCGIALRRR